MEVVAEDENGMTLQLHTNAFETEAVYVGADEYERIRIGEYVHGYSSAVGKPELPLKGILVDVPAGKTAKLSILQTAVETHSGFRIFPVPQSIVDEQGAAAAVGESFALDASAYGTDEFYPQAVAKLGAAFDFREQKKQQVLFYPLSFNPMTGELQLYRQIRLRIDYVDDLLAKVQAPVAGPWKVPAASSADLSEKLAAMGSVAMAFGASPLIVNPLSSIGVILSAVWAPPADGDSSVYKILVSEEGIYRLDADFFTEHGIDTGSIDLDSVRLYCLGEEQAILINDQDSPGSFDLNDYIEFYGQLPAAAYAKYAAQNTYWLVTAGGIGSPKRMLSVDGSPAGGALAASHSAVVHVEDDEYYVGLAPGANERDRWFFDDFVLGTDFTGGAVPVQVPFSLSLPGVAGSGSLKISLWGYYDTDHELEVWVNDISQGTFSWSGIAFYEVNLSGIDLTEATEVKLACNNAMDGLIVDYLDATYPQSFSAVNDSLSFRHDGGYRYVVNDFSTNALKVFDITEAADVAQISNLQITGTGPYTLGFEPPPSGVTDRYLVVSANDIKTPEGIIEDAPCDLADTANQADYILITHKDIGWDGSGVQYGWLTDLVALREDGGLRAKVVDVQDIYDEFSYGIPTPEAIRDFLSYAYSSWRAPAPQYVLLVGDSTYDFKDNYNRGTINYVPAYTVFTDYMGETVTDEYFVTISGEDALPDMYIGRLPAQSAAAGGGDGSQDHRL